MTLTERHLRRLLAPIIALAACGPVTPPGGDGGSEGISIGGIVSRLEGTGLQLQLNGGTALAIESDGAFTFPELLTPGTEYAVTVSQQPSSPAQTCEVIGGTGTANSDVVSITVTCSTERFTLGGTFSNLQGNGLVLSANGEQVAHVGATGTGTGTFTFPNGLVAGTPYTVTVAEQPENPSQVCTVSNGTGSVGTSNVTNIQVSCVTETFAVGGTIIGLEGATVVLEINGGETLSRSTDGNFYFPTKLASGAEYQVGINTQPAGRNCSLVNGSGKVEDGNVTTIRVTCGPASYTVSGTVSGLQGSGLTLRNNGSDDLPITADGAFSFPTPVTGGTPYDVTISVQPSNLSQTCTVSNGSGPGTGDVTNVFVSCSTNSYSIGGVASGNADGGMFLLLADTEIIPVNDEGVFTFPTEVLSGQTYSVSVFQEPPDRNCSVTNGSGTVTSFDVTDVIVTCVVEGDTRETAILIDTGVNPTVLNVDTTSATPTDVGPCGCTDGNDLFFQFTLAQASVVYADNFGTGFDASLYLQDSTGTNITDSGMSGGAACSDDFCSGLQSQVIARLEAGTYYLVLSGCSSGPATVNFSHAPAPSGTLSELAAGTSTVSGTLSGAGVVSGSCATSDGAENAYWWRTCPSALGGTLTATTCGLTTLDTVLHQYSPAGSGACDNDGCGNAQSDLTSTIPAGAGMHLLYVDSFFDPAGAAYSADVTRP